MDNKIHLLGRDDNKKNINIVGLKVIPPGWGNVVIKGLVATQRAECQQRTFH